MRFFSRRLLLLSLPILAGAVLAWFFLKPDPREVFLKQVDELLELPNSRRHAETAEWFSPEAVAYFESETGLTLPQILAIGRRLDDQEGRLYRAGNLDAFYPRDYAEIRIQRSDPGGAFGNNGWFSVPFVYQKGNWKIAGTFRGNKTWDNPGY